MTAHEQVTVAELENQAFSLMGRLHVILRRHSGRITDVEYMRSDPVYCQHVIDLASKIDHEELRQVCSRLQAVYFGAEGLFVRTAPKPPLLAQNKTVPVVPETGAPAGTNERRPDDSDAINRAYIGRLR